MISQVSEITYHLAALYRKSRMKYADLWLATVWQYLPSNLLPVEQSSLATYGSIQKIRWLSSFWLLQPALTSNSSGGSNTTKIPSKQRHITVPEPPASSWKSRGYSKLSRKRQELCGGRLQALSLSNVVPVKWLERYIWRKICSLRVRFSLSMFWWLPPSLPGQKGGWSDLQYAVELHPFDLSTFRVNSKQASKALVSHSVGIATLHSEGPVPVSFTHPRRVSWSPKKQHAKVLPGCYDCPCTVQDIDSAISFQVLGFIQYWPHPMMYSNNMSNSFVFLSLVNSTHLWSIRSEQYITYDIVVGTSYKTMPKHRRM